MLELLVPVLTIVTVFICAEGLVKAGKVPKMPAFYERIVRCGIFNQLMFKNYDFRKTVHDGRMFPKIKIGGLCGLCIGVQKETE